MQLPLRPTFVRIDSNGDGEYRAYERLLPYFEVVVAGQPAPPDLWAEIEAGTEEMLGQLAAGDPEALARFEQWHPAFGFDGADAVWLKGYCHLLSAMTEAILAHDWEASFNQSFHTFFPKSGLPYETLNTLPEGGMADAFLSARQLAFGADLLSFAVHSPWVPTEPERLEQARLHLLGMIATSRQSWAMIAEETDSPADAPTPARYPEWVPGPHQAQWRQFQRVDDQVVAGWMSFLQSFEDMLEGRLLVGHWRFDKGINLRRMLQEPRPLSPILLFQGGDALPYLEDGPVADANHMAQIMGLMGGDFFDYFLWFN